MTYVAIKTIPSAMLPTCPDVTVTAVAEDADAPALRGQQVLEVHYRADTRPPRVGDRLGTWRDVSTVYAMAPRR